MTTSSRAFGLTLAGVLLGASLAQAQFDTPPAEPKSEAAQPAPAAPAEPAPKPEANPFDAPPPAAPAVEPKPDAAPVVEPKPDTVPPAAPEDANPFDSPTPPAPQTPPAPGGAPAPYSASPDAPPAAPAGPAVDIDPFFPPSGMTTAPECLIEAMGFYGHRPFVYSASNCFDLASACYKYGYYEDAIALLSHAIEQEPTARYYYLRGMSQMQAGLSHDAIESADGVWTAQSAGHAAGVDRVRERFNGPLGVEFRELLKMRKPTTGGRSS